MNKFDIIADKLGWVKSYRGIEVFVSKEKDSQGYFSCNFAAATGYDNYPESIVDEQFVKNYLNNVCCCNKFDESNRDWAVPMLVGDYFRHRNDIDSAEMWRLKALEIKRKL